MTVHSRSLHARVERLRELLRSSSDLGAPWDYFHDELTAHPGFGELGDIGVGPSESLSGALDAMATKFFGPGTTVHHHVAIRLPEHGLRHGVSSFGGRLLIYFHFEGVNQGLAGVVPHLGDEASDMFLIRFSFLELPAGANVQTRRGVT